jgi:hypothetical protein
VTADAAALHRLDQRAEIAVAGKQDHLVDMWGEPHGMDSELDAHVTFDLASPGGIDVFLGCLGCLGCLGDDGGAVVVSQSTSGRIEENS